MLLLLCVVYTPERCWFGNFSIIIIIDGYLFYYYNKQNTPVAFLTTISHSIHKCLYTLHTHVCLYTWGFTVKWACITMYAGTYVHRELSELCVSVYIIFVYSSQCAWQLMPLSEALVYVHYLLLTCLSDNSP